MAEWLEQVSQWHKMSSHDLDVMSLFPGWIELAVLGTFVKGLAGTNNIFVVETSG